MAPSNIGPATHFQTDVATGAVSAIDPKAIAAYRAAEYRVHDAPPFVLRLGLACEELGALYKRTRTNCCTYITAYRQFRPPGDDAQSVQRQAALAQEMQGRGLAFLTGVGRYRDHRWPGEPSYVVLGLALEAGRALGRKYAQNGFVWCGADAVARLVLLR